MTDYCQFSYSIGLNNNFESIDQVLDLISLHSLFSSFPFPSPFPFPFPCSVLFFSFLRPGKYVEVSNTQNATGDGSYEGEGIYSISNW